MAQEPSHVMKPPPARYWRTYGNDKLPTGAEALDEPFGAFPSWFLRITCDRCGKLQIINAAHAAWRLDAVSSSDGRSSAERYAVNGRLVCLPPWRSATRRLRT